MGPCMFGLNDDGVMEETHRGIELRIAEEYGFNPELVTLLEGSYEADAMMGALQKFNDLLRERNERNRRCQ